jgi:hypothetical protein
MSNIQYDKRLPLDGKLRSSLAQDTKKSAALELRISTNAAMNQACSVTLHRYI